MQGMPHLSKFVDVAPFKYVYKHVRVTGKDFTKAEDAAYKYMDNLGVIYLFRFKGMDDGRAFLFESVVVVPI